MKVSVCMATFNGAQYIAEQINSILSQLGSNDELIVSDDSSTDNTIEILKSIDDHRLLIYLNNRFRDPIKNFQNALKYATGDVIFLSDQDDVWMDGKYTIMSQLLKQYDLIVSDSKVVDENLNLLSPSFFTFFGSGKGLLKNIIRSSYYGSCMAFKKTVLDAALPFPDTKEIGHDLWIGLVAELTGKVLFYDKPLLLYRRHSSAFTVTGMGKSKRSLVTMLKGRIIMFKELSKFIINQKLKWKKD
jgi:glycosyltransferase involved in cell wall biosynthesis